MLSTLSMPWLRPALLFLLILILFTPPRAFSDPVSQQVLNSKHYRYYRELEYFSIKSSKDLTEKLILEVDRYLRTARRELGQELGFFPEDKITVIFYSSERFQSDITDHPYIHGLYDGTIHIPVPDNVSQEHLKAVIYHEYTHALIHRLCGNRCPLWLNEGFAQYFESQLRPIHIQFAFKPPQNATSDDLERPFQAFETASYPVLKKAGEEAYWVVKGLKNRYSRAHVQSFLRFLRSDPFEGAFLKAFSITFAAYLKRQ